MKAIGLASRLVRDLSEKNLHDLTADVHLEILDAINGGLQKMSALAAPDSKKTLGSISLAAPQIVELEVINGSDLVGTTIFTNDQLYCTIRIDGDSIDNQIVAGSSILHPYSGASGTVSATIYSDAAIMPEPYSELISDPRRVGDRRELKQASHEPEWLWASKRVGQPECYWVESNARNQNPPAPAVIRFHPMPNALHRFEAWFSLAPARISFADLLSSSALVPLRDEEIESYLLPIARGILSSSRLWRDKEEKNAARDAAKIAEQKYEVLSQKTICTPNNSIRTKPGF